MNREIRELLDKKNKYLSKATESLDTISDQTKDTNELLAALRISKKKDNGENISIEESEKLSDVKKHYESYMEDEDGNVDESNTTGGLSDAINGVKEDKLALINKVSELKQKARIIDNAIKEKEKKGSLDDSTENDTKDKKSSLSDDSAEYEPKHKKRKSSLADDSAEKDIKEKESSLSDDSTKNDTKDKISSLSNDSAEYEPKHKKRKSSLADDSAEKDVKETEKKSSLLDDYADTSLEMPEIIDD